MVDWAIAEVKYKAKLSTEIDCIEALDGIWKSDTIVKEELRRALMKAVQPLEDVPEKERDWHPGSNDQVLNLVHPSIYPLVYGQSKILADGTCGLNDCTSWIGKGRTLQIPKEPSALNSKWSRKFQWLPTEFEIPSETESVIMRSYVNNLHPGDHSDLCSVITQIVGKAIPLWDRVLSRLAFPNIAPRVSDWSEFHAAYHEGDTEPESEDEEYWEEWAEWRVNRDVVEPEPGPFKTPSERGQIDEPCVSLRRDYGRLQIIIKLADIHLTPEKPDYAGGSWHVEGQANESICASAIYYYSSENSTASYLSFRQQVDGDIDDDMDRLFPVDPYKTRTLPHPSGKSKAIEQIFGVVSDKWAIQNVGEVLTREGRLLCFPNVMQHRVSPFRLADPSKPGHRKILALFLVDPLLKIISTENVPPQQRSWWRQMVQDTGVLDKLPPELTKNILNDIQYPKTLDQAKEQRLELISERKGFVERYNNETSRRTGDGFVNSARFDVSCILEGTIQTDERQLCEH
ncbi:MAG: hypothetical protein Q9202_007558 [Teloschistes flavicans]